MILLEPSYKIFEDNLRERFAAGEPDKLTMTVADFDGVTYKVSTPDSKSLHILHISMSLKCFPELQQFGADAVLRRIYGDEMVIAPEPGYDVTLRVDQERLPADKGRRFIGHGLQHGIDVGSNHHRVLAEAFIRQIALLKRNALAAPFEAAFAAQLEGRETALMAIHYRDEETIYVKAQSDRVTVIFSTVFKEETDRIFGKVFLQEFVDARRQPAIQNAPQVLYSPREPPLELKGVPGLQDSDQVAYVTFVLFPRHFSKDAAADCISRIQLFRDYLHYHIKASKAYMHSRMRARVDAMMKVLNRAKPENPADKEKKTASGKTFKRS
ncbi:hypothetical protein HK104_004399 [Borealophlyctis nickersoniae]|nr:hypothetical protein HK104_004399 [Borealophlyctis nickersoniae]